MPAPAETDFERLKSQSTVSDLISTAIDFEEQAERFYRSLLPRVRPDLWPLVRELADEEHSHHNRLQALVAGDALADVLHQPVDTPVTLTAFEDMLQPPDLPHDPTDDDLLDYAIARERVAAEHYAALADLTQNRFMRAVFGYLAEEEVSHLAQLAERWGRLSER
jgi:rubrerythrin